MTWPDRQVPRAGDSHPSGSTVGAAALATAAVLATPSRWRPVTAVVATLFSLWMAVAVIALRWHFPSDALAGVAFGVGVVVLVDGLGGGLPDPDSDLVPKPSVPTGRMRRRRLPHRGGEGGATGCCRRR